MKKKKAQILNETIIHLILIGLIFAVFFMATADKINGRGVRQQVLEKEIALLIDSGIPGMDFEIRKMNINGVVQNVELRDGRVFVNIENLISFEGYPYFSKYSVSVVDSGDKFIVGIR
tara:strand:- start:5073 stop:5426 length:354 start_codon:yes stop_codon:yes gene_type:complete